MSLTSADEQVAETVPSETVADRTPRTSRGSRVSRATVVVATLCVAMLLAGAVCWFLAHGRSGEAADRNRALYDTSATTEVEGQVGTGLSRVLTFDYRRPEATRAAADELMRGTARSQYDQLYAALADLAPKQRLSTTVEVRDTAVQSLIGDTAKVLVFLDQTSTRGSDGQRSVGAAQVQVTAKMIDGAWRIVDLDLG